MGSTEINRSSIIAISGSSRRQSSNQRLIRAIQKINPTIETFDIHRLPLFSPNLDVHPWSKEVLQWRMHVGQSQALIITTPVYIYNVPAALKNALEWLTTSGELCGKKVLPITYTPHPPRGEKAMQSLLWSLQALDTSIVTQLPLYQSELIIDDDLNMNGEGSIEMLEAALALLQ